MSAQTRTKLKSLLQDVPPGYLVTAAWLKERGIAYETFRDYVKRGWLERVARGVFRRPMPAGAKALDWQTCLLSMQRILKLDVHAGGMTALEMLGHRHYLPLGNESRVWLYGDQLPTWLTRLPVEARFETRKRALFEEPALGLTRFSDAGSVAAASAWELTISSAERAVLEALDEVPDNDSFEIVDRSFEGLASLRPALLTTLLRSCRRVKTKRLFFVFADRHQHGWRKYLEPGEFDLGRGDRALAPNGALHPRYRIVVPREFLPSEKVDPENE